MSSIFYSSFDPDDNGVCGCYCRGDLVHNTSTGQTWTLQQENPIVWNMWIDGVRLVKKDGKITDNSVYHVDTTEGPVVLSTNPKVKDFTIVDVGGAFGQNCVTVDGVVRLDKNFNRYAFSRSHVSDNEWLVYAQHPQVAPCCR